MSPSARREMIRKENTDLSLTRQCKLLKISRSLIYYTPVGFDRATIDLMHEIDRIFTKYPFFGSRQIAAYLPQSGFSVGRHRVCRLMRIMGLQAIYKGPNTNRKHQQHPIYPHLLRKLAITRPNQVWCSDITYIPVKNGFLYLMAIMDWATRKVLSWRLSNTLHASFCVEALEEPIAKYGKPGIMNTDSHTIGAGSRVVCLNTDRPFAGLVPLGLLELVLMLLLGFLHQRVAVHPILENDQPKIAGPRACTQALQTFR